MLHLAIDSEEIASAPAVVQQCAKKVQAPCAVRFVEEILANTPSSL
jgi:hypothetical protein